MAEPEPHLAGLTVRLVAAADVLDLRHRVLRPGRPREAAVFPGDDLSTTRHFAAVTLAGRVVGCASFHLGEHGGQPAWQLRGMATDPDWAGRGVGRQVLAVGAANVGTAGPTLLWCNARQAAVGFYRRLGWDVCSAAFDIPPIGPHYQMRRTAEADNPGRP